MEQTVIFRDLGQMDYQSAWDYQEGLLQENVRVKKKAFSQESVVDRRKSEVGSQIPTNSEFTIHHSPFTTDPSRLTTTNYLLFVEHPPVFTLGKSGNIQNVL